MTVVRLLLALCCLMGFTACASAAASESLYSEVADWLAANALPEEMVAAQDGAALRAAFRKSPVEQRLLTLQFEDAATAALMALQEARPAYCLTSRNLFWDGLQAHPWFVEHYQPVFVGADAHVGFSPLVLYRFALSPFDGGENVVISWQADSPGVGYVRVDAVRLSHARRIWPQEPLYLALTLQGDVREPLRAVLTLRRLEDERIVFQAVHEQPGGITTDAWFPGRPVEDRYEVLPPADLTPGKYALELAWLRVNGAPFGERITVAQLTRPDEVASLAQTPDHVLTATFGDAIALLGYDTALQVAPGQNLTVTLYWQALANIAADYKVFVHIFAPDGELVAQHDGQPVNWTYPTTAWQVGDFILDRHSLGLSSELARGDYRIFVGFYYAATPDVRLPVFDGQGAPLADGHVELATLLVR